MKNSVGWQIAMNARIGFKLEVTATPGFNSLYDWCFQTMWLFSGAPEDAADETAMEKHAAEALYSAVKCLMHAIRTEDLDAQQDAVHWMIQIAKLWTIKRWSESKLANGKPPVQIANENPHLVHLEWTEEEQAKLKTLVERYTSQGISGAWRIHRWRLAWFSLVLGDTVDWNHVSGQWYNEWPLDTWVDTLIFRWLRDTSLPMPVNAQAAYPEPDKDEASNEALLHQRELYKSLLPCAPPLQMVVQFCTLPGQVCHLKWWFMMFFDNHLNIINMDAEMANDGPTEMLLKFRHSPNPSVFVTTPKERGTGLNLTAANHAVIPQKCWVLNEQHQTFARVV